MRWMTTFLLLVFVVASLAWLGFGDRVRRSVGIDPPLEAASVTLAKLEGANKPEAITRIVRTIGAEDREPVDLSRSSTGDWSQPGKWPVRQADAEDLARVITSLKSRFLPIAITKETDLKPYGLDASQKPVTLRVDTAGKTLTLKFGQATGDGESRFGRTTFLRVDDDLELMRLGPDVYAAITKNAETYRRRQLFPDVTRVKLTGGEPPANPMNPTPPPAAGRVALPTDKIKAIRIEGPGGTVALKRVAPSPAPASDPDRPASEPSLAAARLAGVWEVAEVADPGQTASHPLRDRVDPAKIRSLLTAIPDLWVEQFVTRPETETGLDKPERSIILTFDDGQPRTLRIGKLSRRVVKDGAAPPPANPFGQPPPPPTQKVEIYHYAKLDNNPLVFEIRADKFDDLFAAADAFRDPNLARLETGDVDKVVIQGKGQPAITLEKKKGDKNAAKDEDKQDRWYLDGKLADAPKITELLDALGKLEAREKPDRIDESDPAKLAALGIAPDATKVTVTAKGASTTFVIGKQDAEKKKLNVQVAGWPRVNVVADDVLKLIERPSLAYRGRRLFDTAEARLTGVSVAPSTGEAFSLKQDAEKKWQVTQPIVLTADEAKASQITGDIGRLEVVEFVTDAPTPEDLDKKYGLAKPAFAIKLAFEKGPEQTLEVGKSPEFKQEYYARLAGAPGVFTVPKTAVDGLTTGAVSLLPLQLWSVASDKITGLEITRADGEKYRLAPDAGNWKLFGAFEAPVPYLVAQPILAAVSNLVATKYEALTAADLARFGLDKPAAKLAVTFKETKGEKEETVTKTVIIGGAAPEPAMRYAKLDGSPSVFIMPDAMLKEADKPALDRLDRTLYVVADPMTVTKIVIAGPSPETTTTLVRDGAKWKAEGKPFGVDELSAIGVVQAVTRPMAQKLAAYGAMLKLEEFGLDKPEYTITATLADGKAHVIKVGKAAPGGGRFARVDDGPAIAVFAEPVAKALTRSSLDFVDRALLSFDPSQLTGLTRKEGTEILELVPNAAAGWDIAKPFQQKADQPLMDELADNLSRLRADKVAAYASEDLEAFGLGKPFFTIDLKVGLEKPETKTLKIGLETDMGATGDRYATIDGKTIGVLPGTLVAKLTAAPLKFRDRALARFIDADRATLVRGDRTVTFAKVSGTWKMVSPITTDAEQGELEELLNAAAKLRADELVIEKPASLAPYGLEKPDAVWTFAMGDKQELKLLLGSRDKSGQRTYAKVDGSDIVALLDPALSAKFGAEYRKRSVWTGVDAAQIDVVTVVSGANNFTFKKAGAAWIDDTKPMDKVNAQAITELLDCLAGLKAARYVVDEKADLKLYGLDPAERQITVTSRAGTKTLHLGRLEGGAGGKVYARVSDKDRTEVFVLSEADTTKLLKDRAGYLLK